MVIEVSAGGVAYHVQLKLVYERWGLRWHPGKFVKIKKKITGLTFHVRGCVCI